ncbi:MAG: hypothetical protein WAK20_07705 [Candidatus Acidiferrum sp.]
MEIAHGTTSESVERTGFWDRQFNAKPTGGQVVFDLVFGIVGPVGCLIADPVVFRPDGLAMYGVLQEVRLFAYMVSAIALVALLYWLVTRRGSRVLAGVFYGAAVFSFVLGVAMLPISMLGLFVLIGVLGFMPFLSGFVFWRSAVRCEESGSGEQSMAMVAAGFLAILLVPGVVQGGVLFVANRALARVIDSSRSQTKRDVATLRRLRIAAPTDRIVNAYQATGDVVERARLAALYRAITGERIERRIERGAD